MAAVREKGPAQWHVQIRRKGYPNQTRTFPTKKEADAWARQIESQMDRGVFVDQSGAHRTTLGDLIKTYIKEVTMKRRSENSRKSERLRLERFLREERGLCSYAAIHLTPDHFLEYRDRRMTETVSRGPSRNKQPLGSEQQPLKLRKDGTPRKNAATPKEAPKPLKLISSSTVKRELNLLKKVIDHQKRKLGLQFNPVNTEDVPRLAPNDERDVRLTPEAQNRLLEACREQKNIWIAPLIELAFETGARRGNLLKLRWVDVHLNQRSAILRDIKNSRKPDEIIDHKIGLSPRAIAILSGLSRSLDGRVFPITPNCAYQAFRRARSKAQISDFRIHDARHERVSSLIEAGWSDTEVMAQTGHRDVKSMQRYAHLREEHLADKLAELSNAPKVR